MLHEVIEDGKEPDGLHLQEITQNGSVSSLKTEHKDENDDNDEDDGEIVKDDDAVDYSDITEMSEDCPRSPPNPEIDLEDAIPATKVSAPSWFCLYSRI